MRSVISRINIFGGGWGIWIFSSQSVGAQQLWSCRDGQFTYYHTFFLCKLVCILSLVASCQTRYNRCLKHFIRAPPTRWRSSIVFGLSVCLSVVCCGHSNLVILTAFLPNFIYGLLPSNSGSTSDMFFFPTKDNQDGRQNGRHLSVYIHLLLWSL